ncbi:MAG: hypothetical protein EOP50_02630 [Sphingobacteriales bacterium]|nr:MAG: hypothetical protein EOP50_02630 [Sphingobacteriales bacterium]
MSGDHFKFNSLYSKKGSSFRTGPLAVAGLRYHTLQNFDVTLDASIGITKIALPVPDGYKGKLSYDQIQSLILIGSGLNIPFEKANLMPFIQLGVSFLDFWELSETNSNGPAVISRGRDYRSNRFAPVCGVGIDYQFKLFLSSGLNLRVIYTPLDVFPEPLKIPLTYQADQTEIAVQGKMFQVQLTYRVNLPLAKWKDDYNRQ